MSAKSHITNTSMTTLRNIPLLHNQVDVSQSNILDLWFTGQQSHWKQVTHDVSYIALSTLGLTNGEPTFMYHAFVKTQKYEKYEKQEIQDAVKPFLVYVLMVTHKEILCTRI